MPLVSSQNQSDAEGGLLVQFEILADKEFKLPIVELDDVAGQYFRFILGVGRALDSGNRALPAEISARVAHYPNTIANLENGHSQPFLVGYLQMERASSETSKRSSLNRSPGRSRRPPEFRMGMESI
jgi:hypothetical protein